MPVGRAEVAVEPTVLSPPALAGAHAPPEVDARDEIDGILDETGGDGCSADADIFGLRIGIGGHVVGVSEDVEVPAQIAANAASASYFPSTQRQGKCRVVRRPSKRPRPRESHPWSPGRRCVVARGRLPTTGSAAGEAQGFGVAAENSSVAKENVSVSLDRVRSFSSACYLRPLTQVRAFSSSFV